MMLSVYGKIIIYATSMLILASCFRSGSELEPDPDMGKSKLNLVAVEGKSESESVQFQISLNKKVSEDIVLSYSTESGTATSGVDYVPTSGTITIPGGSTTVLITVPVIDDSLVEATEDLHLVLSGEHKRVNMQSTSATAYIMDDDTYPTASISNISNLESLDASFIVVLDKTYPEDIQIDYSLSSGTADSGSDYTDNSGSLTISSGSTSGTITVSVNDDSLDENDENFGITLSNPVNVELHSLNYQATAIIQDDDGTPNLDVADTTAAEAADITFTVSIPSPSALPINFDWVTSNGTAIDGLDYTSASGSALIPVGSTSVTIDISGLDDALSEDTETINLIISNPSNSMLGDATGVGSITDDDPLPSISIADLTINENENAVLTVTMNSIAGRDVSFDWTTSDATATSTGYLDFTAVTTTTTTISAGDTTATLNVSINNDNTDEPDETFDVNLSNPVDLSIADSNAEVTIQDDDDPPTVDWSTASLSINEGEFGYGTNRISLTFSNASRSENLVDFPVLVRLNSSRIDYSKTKDDGADIRFTDSDGSSLLAYEIEKWDEGGESLVWVKVPQIDGTSSADHIFMYYGNSSLSDNQSPEDVWNNDYVGVYHMSSNIDLQVLDSTRLAKHAVNLGGVEQSGQIGNSLYLDGSDLISLGTNNHLPLGNSEISVCSWASESSTGGSEMMFGHGTNSSSDGYFIGHHSYNRPWAGTFGGNNHYGNTTIPSDTWHYICGTYSPGNSRVYYNGSLEDIESRNYNFTSATANIGANPGLGFSTSYKYTGNLDEVRISQVRRSTDWINAEFASMNDSLITYGAEEQNLNQVSVTANLSGLSGYDISIPYTIGGTSDSTDHNASDGTLNIAAETGTSVSFTIDIENDLISEVQETLSITLGSLVNADPGTINVQNITINDDEANPLVNFSVVNQDIFESSWWNASWSHRSKITIDAKSIGSSLTGFPVLVKLNSSKIDYSKTQNSGQDIRFVAHDSSEIYPHEIESWDESGDSFVWVRIPQISANKNTEYFYIYYDNSGASDAQNTAAVWNENYNLVMHMNSNGDSTGFASTGIENSVTSSSDNFIGPYKTFPNPSSSTSLGYLINQPVELEPRTYCAWTYGAAAGTGTGQRHILTTTSDTSDTDERFMLYRNSDGLRGSIGGTASRYTNIDGAFEVQRWSYFCFGFNGSQAQLFVDGVMVDTHDRSNVDTRWGITSISDLNYGFEGSIDEVRISNISRDESWIKAEYLSGKDSFLSYSTEQAYIAATNYQIKITSSHESVNQIDIPLTITGTSTNPADHDLSNITLSIPAGQKEVSHSFSVVDDSTVESDETIVVTMGTPTNATAGGVNVLNFNLIDNEKVPVLNFTKPTQVVSEAAGSLNIELKLNRLADSSVTIPYTIGGKANNPDDHDLVDGSATISPGSDTTTISVTINDDSIDEWGEEISIQLGSLTGAVLGPIDTHRLYIEDNDIEPSINVNSPTVSESTATVDFIVSLSSVSGKDIEFDYDTSDITAKSSRPNKNYDSDSVAAHIIPAGASSITISIPIYDNNYDEVDKTFALSISNPWQASLGTDIGTATIQDDETSPVVKFSQASRSIDEGGVWWDSSFSDRVRLTFNNQSSSSNLNNFPVLVKLDSSRIDYSSTEDAGGDIRFIDDDGITLLNHEIEVWNEAGDSFVWVKVPQIDANSGSDHIWLYYGNGSVSDNQNPQQVWGSPYQGVWHFNGDTEDSGGSGTNFTENNITDVTGPLGTAKKFVASNNSYMESSDDIFDPSPHYFFEAWVRSTSVQTSNALIIHKQDSYEWGISRQSIKHLHESPWTGNIAGYESYPVGVWQHVTFSYDGDLDLIRQYVNGELAYEKSWVLSGYTNNNNLFLGTYFNPVNYFIDMELDELRFSDQKPNPDWIKAQYLSQSDQFIDYSNNALSVELDLASEVDITVPYTISGTATNPADHNATNSSLVIPAFSKGKSISLNIVNDSTSESDETVVFTMGIPSNATKGNPDVHTTTIIDDDGKSSLSINDISVTEGSVATLTVSLTPSSASVVSVDFQTQNLSANSASDYTTNTGSISFAPGETSKTINITTTADTLDEYNEVFYTVLSNQSADAKIVDAVGRVTINDDDPLVNVQFSTSTNSASESTSLVTVTAEIDAVSAKLVRLPFSISGTSINPDDHDAQDAFIQINSGSTSASYTFNIANDSLDEYDETVILTAGSPLNSNLDTNTVHTYTITDDDAEPTISLNASAVIEGSSFNINATLDAVSAKNVSFSWTSNSGTADKGIDFSTTTGGNYIIPAGSTALSAGVLNTFDDQLAEGTETLSIVATSVSNASLGAATDININDNESPVNISFSQTNVDVMESDNYKVIIELNSISTSTIQVDLSLSGTTTPRTDYSLSAGTINIPPGLSNFEIPLDLVDDAISEGDETLILELSSPIGASLGANTQLTVNIKDAGQFSVDPVYTGNSNWNDYIAFDEQIKEKWKQSNDACNGVAATSQDQCIHGAEYFMADLGPSYTSCTNLEMRDALELFEWVCDESGPNVVFYSKGINTPYPLSKIVDMSSENIKENAAILNISGVQTEASFKSAWWTNNVSSLPDSSSTSVSLNTAGTIYYYNNDRQSMGYSIDADKVSILGSMNNKITASATIANNCNTTTGESTPAFNKCIITSGSQKYLHLESVKLDGANNSDIGLLMESIMYSKIFSVHSDNHLSHALALSSFNSVELYYVLANNSAIGLTLNDIAYSRFLEIETNSNSANGMELFNCNSSSFHRIKSGNNGSKGLYLGTTSGNDCSFTSLLLTNNQSQGLDIQFDKRAIFQNISSINNAANGIRIDGNASYSVFNNIFVANNGLNGIDHTGGNLNINFSQIASMNNSGYGIDINSDNNYFTNNLLLGNNGSGDCQVSGAATKPGLVDSTCANNANSNANQVNSLSSQNSFIGKIDSEDLRNTSDSLGAASFASYLAPYFDFDLRNWGKSGSSYPNSDHQGRCSSGTCHIWDWRLKSDDIVVRNTSANGLSQNTILSSGVACPAYLDGNLVLNDFNGAENNAAAGGDDDGNCEAGEVCLSKTWLVNAIEITKDFIGNDDGLCESNESCVVNYNFGIYQGEGDPKAAGVSCIFQDARVSNVLLYSYPKNGN